MPAPLFSQAVNGIDAVLREIGGGAYDIQIDGFGDVLTEDAFDAAILVSLLSDRRASASEVLASNQRRGWIGNESTPGAEMGSKLWLFEQSRATQTILNQVADAAKAALQWLVEDGFAISVIGAAPRRTANGMALEVTIQRSPSEVETKFFPLWDLTGVA